jgi:hypothetical protein
LLARIAIDAGALAQLEAVSITNALVTAGIRTQREMLIDGRYTGADDDEQGQRRALLWHASILCGVQLSHAVRNALVDVPADDIAETMRTMTQCPR